MTNAKEDITFNASKVDSNASATSTAHNAPTKDSRSLLMSSFESLAAAEDDVTNTELPSKR